MSRPAHASKRLRLNAFAKLARTGPRPLLEGPGKSPLLQLPQIVAFEPFTDATLV